MKKKLLSIVIAGALLVGCSGKTEEAAVVGDAAVVDDAAAADPFYIYSWDTKLQERLSYVFAKYPEIQTPKEIDDSYCVYHQYTIKIENRDEVHKLLLDKGIGAMIYYPVPLHLQKLHKELGYKVGDLPKTEKDTTLVMSLPMFPELTVEEQQTVVNTVVECLNLTKQTV